MKTQLLQTSIMGMLLMTSNVYAEPEKGGTYSVTMNSGSNQNGNNQDRKSQRGGLSSYKALEIDADSGASAIALLIGILLLASERVRSKRTSDKPRTEYDFVYEGIQEAEHRKQGINPMKADYIAKVEAKRKGQGSAPDMATSNDTMEMCSQEAKIIIDGLRIRIDEILFYRWDPLQVSDSNWARDEYAAYVPEILRLTLESASYQPIADHLTKIATEIMSCAENRPHNTKTAELIFCLTQNESYLPAHTIAEVE